jgi:diguanylate cyclase (GGDEF)-like protein
MIKTHTKLAIQTKELKEANEKLEYMATKDYLTGVNNRGNFFELAKKIWEQPLEENKKIYIAMFDLDKFKNINDTYGHQVGDTVLKEFANSISLDLDDNDIFARIGGEEFALLTISEDEKLVIDKLEKMRRNVEKLSLISLKDNLQLTVSIGLSSKKDNQTIDETLDFADKKLYEAKNSGRNNVKFRV